jgi:hypothetical protein
MSPGKAQRGAPIRHSTRVGSGRRCLICAFMEQYALKNVNNDLNTNIFFYSDTSGGSSSNLYLNVVHFFYTAVNWTSVADQGICFPALVSNTAEAVFLVVCDLSMN